MGCCGVFGLWVCVCVSGGRGIGDLWGFRSTSFWVQAGSLKSKTRGFKRDATKATVGMYQVLWGCEGIELNVKSSCNPNLLRPLVWGLRLRVWGLGFRV